MSEEKKDQKTEKRGIIALATAVLSWGCVIGAIPFGVFVERDLSKAKDDIVRAQRVDSSAIMDRADEMKEQALKQFSQDVVAWAQRNSTLAFPAAVLVKNEKLTLMDRSQKVKQPVNVGEAVRALRFHPSAQGYLIVGQLNREKLLTVSMISNLNFEEALASKYANHMKSMGKSVSNPYSKKKSLTSSGSEPRSFSPSSIESPLSAESAGPQDKVLKSKAMLPQKSEDFLKSTSPGKSMENDHGNSCVCKDCRAKKMGKGSLFPE